MEYLKQFDWLKRVPDGKNFIKNDNVLDESTMFRIVRGTFQNPLLQNSEEEVVTKDSLSHSIVPKKFKKKPKSVTKYDGYIPGLRKLPFHPQMSQLSLDQHKLCIKVLQSNSYCITMSNTRINDKELQIYNNLIPTINEEQRLFMEHVKNIWITENCVRHLRILPEHEVIVEKLLDKHRNLHKKYPQFYQLATMLPLMYNNIDAPVELCFIEKLYDMDLLPPISIPSLNRKFLLSGSSKIVSTSLKLNDTSQTFFNRKFGVSEDNRCEEFALKHLANIVISSNGLKLLSNNQPPFSQTWVLPILVKEYLLKDSQNKPHVHTVVYIDKALPNSNLSAQEKNYKCYKFLLKTFLLHHPIKKQNLTKSKHETSLLKEPACSNDDIQDSINNEKDPYDSELTDEENLIIDDSWSNEIKEHDKLSDLNASPTIKFDKTKDDKSSKKESTNTFEHPNSFDTSLEYSKNEEHVSPNNENKISYNLWKIGQQSGKNPLSKNLEGDIKMIVRSKIDGYELDEQGNKHNLCIVPKLEYQLEYGGEISTATESAHQWTLLQFRPESKLLRARIVPNSSEIVMVEKLSLSAITNEATKKGHWKPKSAIGCYFNIFSKLSKLQPGQYMLKHEPKHHAFAVLYSSVLSSCENGLDLYNHNNSEDILNTQTAPWTPIDPNIVTPNLVHNSVMPCMFKPGKCKLIKHPLKKEFTKNKPNRRRRRNPKAKKNNLIIDNQ